MTPVNCEPRHEVTFASVVDVELDTTLVVVVLVVVVEVVVVDDVVQ